MARCEKCGAELADIQHGAGVHVDLPERGAQYPKWIEALGRVVHSKQEEDAGLTPAPAPKTAVEGEAVAPKAPAEAPKTG